MRNLFAARDAEAVKVTATRSRCLGDGKTHKTSKPYLSIHHHITVSAEMVSVVPLFYLPNFCAMPTLPTIATALSAPAASRHFSSREKFYWRNINKDLHFVCVFQAVYRLYQQIHVYRFM
jgi:hypothetical protein